VTALFSSRDLKSKQRSPGRDRRRPRQIPTGTPRLMESSAERLERMSTETWAEFVNAIRRSSTARLDLLKSRDGSDQIPCPWERLVACDKTCRCGGSKRVTVDFMRKHYGQLATEIAKIVSPAARRSP
jgi:hypothetical protein